MLQFQLYTFFFFFLSAIFATGTPTCSKRHRCSSITPCKSVTGIPTALPTPAIGYFNSSVIPSQASTHNPIPPPRSITTPTPISSSQAVQATPAPSPSGSAGDTSNADIQAYLTAHNSVRAKHGAAPLTWSNNLASSAQKWANGCVFKHSGGTLGPFGENLAAGTGSYPIADAVKAWTDEASDYDPNNPTPSHFTQVVWKATTQVGCAVQTCNGIFDASFGLANYYVCEYSPAGNVIGSFSQNVQV